MLNVGLTAAICIDLGSAFDLGRFLLMIGLGAAVGVVVWAPRARGHAGVLRPPDRPRPEAGETGARRRRARRADRRPHVRGDQRHWPGAHADARAIVERRRRESLDRPHPFDPRVSRGRNLDDPRQRSRVAEARLRRRRGGRQGTGVSHRGDRRRQGARADRGAGEGVSRRRLRGRGLQLDAEGEAKRPRQAEDIATG
jgi:hypothetical protein